MAAKLIGERLPQNWSYAVTRDGRIFFIDDRSQVTTWVHPFTGQPVQTGYTPAQGLPQGWEQALTIDGTIFFIDHNRRITTFEHPVTGQSVMEAPERTPPQSPLTKGSQHRKSGKSRHMKAPSASREENSKVILRGWLQKQESGGLKLWKKKWCVLADFGLFFYKDENEHNCIGSILLPSYAINPCRQHDVNKKYACKAEHENMKTFYFAAENQVDMERWVEALKMASLVQRAPGSGHVPKLIPKSPIMSWNDTIDSPGAVSPPDMQQYPFSGQGHGHETPRESSSQNSSFIERTPLQSQENVPNYMDPHQRSKDQNGIPPGSFGSLPRDNRGQGHPNGLYDPRYPSDTLDTSRMSQRSNRSQGNSLPEDQRSMSSVGQRSGQFPSNTLPKNARPNQLDTRNAGPPRGQGYSSLPREQRGDQSSRVPPGHGHTHDRTHEYRDKNTHQLTPKREDLLTPRREDNPYMMMMSPNNQSYERKMDPMKHSNRPLPQEPRQERPREPAQRPASGKSGGGDYASLTRVKEKWPNQQLSDSMNAGQPGSRNEVPRGTHLSPTQQQRPDLYVDIPHTYVNVYDESQVRDMPPELPSRPPLPAEMRHKIVEDIAKTHSPNTQKDLLTAENNLEQRMKQPAFFNYPTPTRESLPPFPQQQDSPRSQYSQRSQRSQRSQDPRSQEEFRGQPKMQRRQDVALEAPMSRHEARNAYQPPHAYGHNLNDSNLSNNLDGSTDTLTNEDERNDKISEFYGLGKYNTKNGYPGQKDKTRFMSDTDVRANTLPSKPISGVTGEKDFRLRSLPDHVQSMPALYHEQPLSVQVPGRDHAGNSYVNLAQPSSMQNGHPASDIDQRKSAFRPLSANSLQRIPSTEGYPGPDQYGDYRETGRHGDFLNKGQQGAYPNHGHPGDVNRSSNYSDHDQTDVKGMSPRNYQSQNKQLPRKQEKRLGNLGQGQNKGQGQRLAPTIHTVKEDEDMPDSQVIETDLPKRVFPLNGPRLRMSISATDLLGKTHDELVLLLIQLRRDKSELNDQRDGLRKAVDQNRPAEFFYRKLQNEGRPIDGERESQHRKYQDLKHKLDEVEKKLEVYKPLINLVCNMVTMGSLYGGDNLMLATEYRKHLLSPEQYSPPKKMIEFSRKHQEEQVVQGIEDDVRQLTKEQADLEEKLNRLYDLDKVMQDQSFQVTSLKEDREMLERALGGLLKKQDQHCTNPRELDKLLQQQKTIEKELSRVLQQLAEASKELEETTAENNKLEHEVALLRSKVHGNVSRSKSAPSLSSESLRTKMKMEKDLARVKNIMAGLSEEGARLQEMMSTLRKPKAFTDPNSPTSPVQKLPLRGTDQKDSKKSTAGNTTYYETDLDNGQSKDLAQVTALLASYHLLPGQAGSNTSPEPVTQRSEVARSFRSPPPSTEEGTSAFRTVSPSRKEDDTTYHASLVQATFHPTNTAPIENSIETDGAQDQWDIGAADDNTKRFYGLIPRNMPKQQTVRDVKRISETRKDSKKKEDSPPLQVGVVPSEYNETTHVYENLPQQKSVTPSSTEQKVPWAALLKDGETTVAGTQRRRSNLHLIAPKPFSLNSKPTPYSSVNNVSSSSVLYNSQNLDQSDAPLHNHNTQDSQSQPFSDNLKKIESSQSNDSYKPTEPMKTQLTSKTPPPPPVRGTSRYLTADSAQLESLKEMFRKSSTNRNYEPPEPAILRKGRNSRSGQKARYLTISSSEPIKLEKSSPQSPKHHSQAGELISSMEVPDIVKSSTTKADMYDERTIDREILYFPDKVEIPERYIPDSDDESITEEEKVRRKEKANKIKKILTQQSVHSLSQPDVSKVAGEVHERVQQEKQQRALLLGISQELAEQVKRKSRQYAAERRKTWSGTTHKPDVDQQQHAETDDEDHHGNDANNNSYVVDDNAYHDHKDSYHSDEASFEKQPSYSDLYSGDGHYNDNSRYYDTNYSTTSYLERPNFKI